MDEHVINKLKQENVKLYQVEVTHDEQDFELLVSPPSKTVYDAVKKLLGDGAESKANEMLVYSCVKHPDKLVFAEMFKDHPILFDKLSNKILELAGSSAEFKCKKL